MDPNAGVVCHSNGNDQENPQEPSTHPKSPPKSPDEETVGTPEFGLQTGEQPAPIGSSQPPSTGQDSVLPSQPVDNTPPPTPIDSLSSSNLPPPFLTKTYDMVEDPATDDIVSWTQSNTSFVVWDPAELARDVLPKYFKHNNFSSFVRQLNTYGFRKVDPDQWEFYNKWFVRGQKHFLKNIHRRKPERSQLQQHGMGPSSVGACIEVGKFGLEGDIEQLKRDKNVLMLELVRLRRNQELMDNRLQVANSRLGVMEQQQQTVMAFLAEFVKNPSFLAQFVQRNDKAQPRITVRKKRRLPPKQNGGLNGPADANSGQLIHYHQFQPMAQDTTRASLTELTNDSDITSTPMDTAEEGIGQPDRNVSNSALESFLRDLNAHLAKPSNHLRTSGLTLTEVGQLTVPATMMPTLSNGSPEAPVAGNHQETASGMPAGMLPRDGSAAHVPPPPDSTSSITNGPELKQEYTATAVGAGPLSSGGNLMGQLVTEPLPEVSTVVNEALAVPVANGGRPVAAGEGALICATSDASPSPIDQDLLLEDLGEGLMGGEGLEVMNLLRVEEGDQQARDGAEADHVHGTTVGEVEMDAMNLLRVEEDDQQVRDGAEAARVHGTMVGEVDMGMDEEQESNAGVSNAVTLFDDASFWANLFANHSEDEDSALPLSIDDGAKTEGVGSAMGESTAAARGDMIDSSEIVDQDGMEEGQTLWWLPSQVYSDQLDNIVEQMGQLAPLNPS
ncbi:hypothetical protein CBR_g40773 [Chara braunii]|uniref:HSF-type DNA-binding domain-containing protein n=1 Tax=Chara braunii TaxID=69332 RepID=A0A388LUN0_CHABU|nr:hypothetical protein CBR_g40773 [Chara braunii]|eukprot:GBG85961.1 hypothetical protein CBR_g40773 [Chara braunii]